MDELERQLKETRRDKDSILEQNRDLQRQLESQRETVVGRFDREREIQERMTERNRLLAVALEENKHLAQANADLDVRLVEMRDELVSGQSEIEKTRDAMERIKVRAPPRREAGRAGQRSERD